ncbi:hypothetical protein BMA10247_2263 [Burkholderia mallei NCTC 10247]|nr:hypothetical protein BMA10247_2263 [Burkholderia mallei NCTC 10247]
MDIEWFARRETAGCVGLRSWGLDARVGVRGGGAAWPSDGPRATRGGRDRDEAAARANRHGRHVARLVHDARCLK